MCACACGCVCVCVYKRVSIINFITYPKWSEIGHGFCTLVINRARVLEAKFLWEYPLLGILILFFNIQGKKFWS